MKLAAECQCHPLLTALNIRTDFTKEYFRDTINVQSIGAAIQNILLAATGEGLGSLWICDIFFAYEELCEWLGGTGELLAAVALGFPAEAPKARPRKGLEEVVKWRE